MNSARRRYMDVNRPVTDSFSAVAGKDLAVAADLNLTIRGRRHGTVQAADVIVPEEFTADHVEDTLKSTALYQSVVDKPARRVGVWAVWTSSSRIPARTSGVAVGPVM